MGSGRSGRRQRPHRDGGQGRRDVAEPSESDRKPGHLLHDARVKGRSRDDGRQKDIPVQQFDCQSGRIFRERRRKRFGRRAGSSAGLSAVHEYGHDEPWRLAANCPHMRGRRYGMRVWEELMFRDCKTGGWQWRKSRVRDPGRAGVLWLAMSAAYLWMLSLGASVCRSEKLRRRAVGRKWRVVSAFRLGLALFQLRLRTSGRIPCALSLPTNPRAAKKRKQASPSREMGFAGCDSRLVSSIQLGWSLDSRFRGNDGAGRQPATPNYATIP